MLRSGDIKRKATEPSPFRTLQAGTFNLKFNFTPIKEASVCEIEQEGKEASLLKRDFPVGCAGLTVSGLNLYSEHFWGSI